MKTYFIKDAHGPHYEWLMEKTKNLVEYAKREDYKKVAAFCENILEGLRNNKLVDSETKDSEFKNSNAVHYKFERGYWHVFSIYNRNKLDDRDVMSLARKYNVIIKPYSEFEYERTDKGYYYFDYKVKGKDKNNVIKFCETLNPEVRPLSFEE